MTLPAEGPLLGTALSSSLSSTVSSSPLAVKLRVHAGRDPLSLGQVPAGQPAPRTIRVVPLEFRGEVASYYRIWLVNAALSIITLGLYLPWARVRLRQYFYGHTFLEGYNFSYDASPVSLLLGYLVVGALFATFTLAQNLEGWRWLSLLLGGLFYLLYPWLLYRSLRFQARNTLHRGLRFGFDGGALMVYALYGLLPLSFWMSGGLTVPLAQFLQRRYLLQSVRYGQSQGQFRGNAGPVYLAYLLGFGGLVALLLLIAAALLAVHAVTKGHAEGWQATAPYIAGGLLAAASYLAAGQFIRAQLLRYTLEQSQLGGTLRFRVRYRPLGLAWVLLSNLLAQVLTLGLASPWAAIRYNRYLLGHIDILTLAPLSEYHAAGSTHEGALGEAAAELFDIGLHL